MNKFVEFAPLRTLDDFLLESARFQIPNFSDWEKWGYRITSNLLYYQTNYFLTAIIIFILFGFVHPLQVVVGFLAMIIVGGLFAYVTNEAGPIGDFKARHPIISAVVVCAIAYYLLAALLGSLIIFLLALLTPLCTIFIHASFRLRNVKNKIANTIEPIALKKTPMGVFLDAMGLQAKSNTPSLVGNLFKLSQVLLTSRKELKAKDS